MDLLENGNAEDDSENEFENNNKPKQIIQQPWISLAKRTECYNAAHIQQQNILRRRFQDRTYE